MMDTIGVAVEGPSDLRFWRKYLHRTYRTHKFHLHNMRGRSRLIREAPHLLDLFHDLHHVAGLIILDQDKDPCVSSILNEFTPAIRDELSKPLAERYLHLCVAHRKIESWFLADSEAVRRVLPDADYDMPDDTRIWGAGKLGELWKQQHGRTSTYNKIDFAESIALYWSPHRAEEHSASLRIARARIESAATRSRTE